MSILTASEQSSFCTAEHVSGSNAAPSLGKVMQFSQNGVIRTILVPNKSAECNSSRTRPREKQPISRLTSKLQRDHAVVTSLQAGISQSPSALSAVKKRVSSYCQGTENGTEQVRSSQVRSVIPIMPKTVASSCVLPPPAQPSKSKTIGRVNTTNEKLLVADLAKRGGICARQRVSKRRVTSSAFKEPARVAKRQVRNVESSDNIPGEELSCDLIGVRPVSLSGLNSSKNQSHVVETSMTGAECLSRVSSCSNVGLSPFQSASCASFEQVETGIRKIAPPKKDISAPSTRRASLSKNTSSSAKKLRTIAAAGPVPASPNMSSFSISPAQKAPHVTQLKNNAVEPTFTQFKSIPISNNVAAVASPYMDPLVITSPMIRLENAGTVFAPVPNIGTSQHGVASICMQQQRQFYPMTGVSGVYTQPTYAYSPLQLADSNGPMFVGMPTDGVLRNTVVPSSQPTNLIVIQNSNVFLCSPVQQSNFTGSAMNMQTVPATGVLPVQSSMSNLIMPGHGSLVVQRADSQSCVKATGFSLQPFVQSTTSSSHSSLLNGVLQRTAGTYPSVMQTSLAINAKPSITYANSPSSGHAHSAALKACQLAANPSATSRAPTRRKVLNEGSKTWKSRHRQPNISRKKIGALSRNTFVAEKNEELTAKSPLPESQNRKHVHMKEKTLSSQTPRPILPRPSSLASPIAIDAVNHTSTSVVFSRQKKTGLTKSPPSVKPNGRIRSIVSMKSPRSRTKRPKPEELACSDEHKLHETNIGKCGKCGSESISTVETTLTMSEICETCQSQNVTMRISDGHVDLRSSESETADDVNSVNCSNHTSKEIQPRSDTHPPISHHELLPKVVLDTKDTKDCAVVESRNSCSLINSISTNTIGRMFNACVRLERMTNIATNIGLAERASPSLNLKLQINGRKLVQNTLDGDVPSVVETVILQRKKINHSSQIDRSTADLSALSPSGTVLNRMPCKRLNSLQSARTKRLMFKRAEIDKGGGDATSVVDAVISKQRKTDTCNTSQNNFSGSGASVVSGASISCTVSSLRPRPSKRLNSLQSIRTKRFMLKRAKLNEPERLNSDS